MSANKNRTSLSKNEGELSSADRFPYPACWTDNERMDVLRAPFRVRSVNPENYDSKMKFWQDLIAQYCAYKGCALFSKRELQLQFARGERLPKCLDAVLEELQRARQLRSRADYEYDPANSWSGWATSLLLRRPAAWGWARLRHSVGGGAAADEDQRQQGLQEWVHLEVMKQLCCELHAQVLQPQQGKLLHYDVVRQLVAAAAPALNLVGDDCLRLCLHTLHAQRRIGLEWQQQKESGGSVRGIHLVKVPSKTDATAGVAVVITESDRAIHNLQMTQTSLLAQLEQLADDIKANETKARDYLKENKRQLAKTYLRKKHLLEKNHEKRSIALHNIETLLCSVDEAHSNGEILDAYKIGSKALQTALNASGLKYDNVDEVLADVRDTIETHQEVQDALANAHVTTTAADDEDMDELERELQEIMGGSAGGDSSEQSTPQRPMTTKSKQPEAAAVPKAAAVAAINNNNAPARIASAAPPPPPKPVIEITDAELLAMLEGLEVEQESPPKSSKNSDANANTVVP